MTLNVIRLGVFLVAAGSAVVSFVHVHRFALSHGETELTAVLLPLVLDGATAAGAAAVLGWDRSTGRKPVMPWVLLVLGLGGSLAGNIAAASTLEGRIGAALPPVLLLFGVEVLAGLSRPVRPGRPAADRADQDGPAPVRDWLRSVLTRRSGTAVPVGSGAGDVSPSRPAVPALSQPVPAASGATVPALAGPLSSEPSKPYRDDLAKLSDSSPSRSAGEIDEVTLRRARDLDQAHRAETGKPITRVKLRAELGCGNAKASAVLNALKEGRRAA